MPPRRLAMPQRRLAAPQRRPVIPPRRCDLPQFRPNFPLRRPSASPRHPDLLLRRFDLPPRRKYAPSPHPDTLPNLPDLLSFLSTSIWKLTSLQADDFLRDPHSVFSRFLFRFSSSTGLPVHSTLWSSGRGREALAFPREPL